MYDIVAIGDPTIDTHVQIDSDSTECEVLELHNKKHLSFEYGGKIPIVDSFLSLGGNAANAAIALNHLGLNATLVSTIGDDAFGQMVVGELERYGVATDFILIDPLHHTRYSIVLNYRGERTILSYSDEKTYEWPENFPETAWIYYAGLSKGFEPMHQQLLALKQEHPEVRLAVNPGSYMLKYALDALYETIAVADILILNREEAQHILELPPTSELTEVALLFGLNELGVDEIVITDGDQGAWAGSADGQWHIERYPVEVVAKTGAGDAFAAGYVAARAKGLAVPDALQWGAANGAAVVSAHGPHAGLLKEDDITQFIQKFLTIKPILL